MNYENMNTLIDAIEKAPAAQCIMSRWVSGRTDGECGTAYCIGGWTSHLVGEGIIPDVAYEVTSLDESHYVAKMRAVLEISREEGDQLALMSGYMYANRLENFDALPPSVRKEAMLNVLRLFRDNGDVDWETAIHFAKASYGY